MEVITFKVQSNDFMRKKLIKVNLHLVLVFIHSLILIQVHLILFIIIDLAD